MGKKSVIQLLSAAAGVGNGGPNNVSLGGTYQYSIAGTFGGTTAKLQTLGPDGSTYVDYPSVSHTAAAMMNVDLPAGATVRSVMTSGSPTGMNATLSFIR